MNRIIIGFSKSKKILPIFSWLIRLVEGTKYSHVYVKFPKKTLKTDLIYHASGLMVNFMGEKAFEDNHKTIEEFQIFISDDCYHNVLNYAAVNSGASYSVAQIFGIAAIRLFAVFGKVIKNPFSNSGYVCTELVAEILKEINIKINKPVESIGLRDINNLVKSFKKTTVSKENFYGNEK